MSNLNIENKLDEEQRTCLKKFRTIVEHLDQTMDDYSLFRFLKARDFDLNKAEYMITEHFKFRHMVGTDTILEDFALPEVIVKYIPYYYIGTDTKGNGIFSLLIGAVDPKGIVYSLTLKDHMKSLVYVIEEVLAKMGNENAKTGKSGGKLVAIFDFHGLQLYPLFDKRVIRHVGRVIMTFDRNYPEMLEAAYAVNVPSFFPSWFSLIKKLTRSEALKKVKVYGSDGWKEELCKQVDPSKLPAVLGGKLCDPDGSTECRSMYCKGGKVPEELYAFAKHLSTMPEDDVCNVVVREKTFFNEEVFIKESNTILKWSFETVDNNIGFAVFYVPAGVKPMPKVSVTRFSKSFRYKLPKDPKEGHVELVPMERVNSQYMTEEGELLCQKPGTYLVHFDNTFSWITPKKLYYKIDIIPQSSQVITELLDVLSVNSALV